MSYRFTDMIKKGDTYWAVSTTTVGCIAPLKNVATADIELPENEKAEGAPRSLMDALQCPQKSSVKGKIVQISPLKRRRNGTLVVRSISLKDTSGVAKVCLFEGTAEMQFERDQILEVTSVYPKSFQGAQQLTGSVSTKCQFVQDENFNDLQVTDEDFLEDHDFDVEEDLSNGDPFQVIMISDAYRYLCCPSPGCRKKKNY
ncbi:uncharacterized protein LOC134259038 [Saccostrea cucullata]|uniref:uncharacterized protein LOC134259038 n=1 Tax=Saccostrea cuccullata TaxID=36930 RepID=UPI002ED00EAA